MTEKGLVLEGGGLRGNYTAGVLDAFLDAGAEFPYVIGVSAGAGMGCSFVSRQRGRNLEILQKFHGDPRYLSLWNFIATRSLFGMDFVFHQIPAVHVPFDWKSFVSSPSRFTAVCTDCATGEAVYFEKSGTPDPEQFYTVLEASASMPYAAPMVSCRGWRCLDGAIVDAIPLDKAVSEGFTRNVVVLTNPAGYRKKQEPAWMAGVFYGRWKNLAAALKARVEKYNKNLAHVEEEAKAGRITLIRPSKDLHVSRVEQNKAKLVLLYQLGYGDAQKALRDLGR